MPHVERERGHTAPNQPQRPAAGGEPPPLLAEIRLYTHSVTLPVVLHSRVKQKERGAARTASFDGSSTLRSGISAAVGR